MKVLNKLNTLANKTALYITIAFALLLAVLTWLLFTLTTKQFFSYHDVSRQIDDLSQTLGKQAVTIQTQLAHKLSPQLLKELPEQLSQQIPLEQSKDVQSQNISARQKQTEKRLKAEVLSFIDEQEKDWPFIVLFGDQKNNILAANPANFIGMHYQRRKQKIKLSTAEDEYVLPLNNVNPITMHGGYFLIVIPFPGTDNIDRVYFSIKSTVLLLFVLFLTIGLVLIWLIVQRSLDPIKQLNIATSSIALGLRPELLTVTGNDEVAQLTKNFNLAIASLKQQDALRKKNLTDVSHELRTPLTIMIGKLDAWRDGLIKDENQIQTTLMQEAKQLSFLVNDLQDLALAQANELNLYPETFNVADALHEITHASQYAVGRRNIAFISAFDTSLSIFADVARFKQIIHNLCINAIKHNHGDIEITLKVQQDEQHVHIQIIDNGIGIGENQVNAIFNRRTQFSENTSGLGLGLSIAKNLMELHKGKILVNSKPGSTCFSLLFPRPEYLYPEI